MSKMSEISQILDDISSFNDGLNRAIADLKEILSAPEDTDVEMQSSEEQKPTTVTTYEFTDVRKACAEKSHEGHTDEVKALITKYGAKKLSEIKKEDYPSLMADLEEIK